MDLYDDFQKAFAFYNKALFGGSLPPCIITLQRIKRVKGYYSNRRFVKSSLDGSNRSEIALNPDYFGVVSDIEVLSTLVHEMCHMKMDLIGKQCANGYHDRLWAKEMLRVGLIPTNNGKENGSQTGYYMTQLIDKDGFFQYATEKLINEGFKISYYDKSCLKEQSSFEKREKRKRKVVPKFKYSCGCSTVWGIGGLKLKCGLCGRDFEIVEKDK